METKRKRTNTLSDFKGERKTAPRRIVKNPKVKAKPKSRTKIFLDKFSDGLKNFSFKNLFTNLSASMFSRMSIKEQTFFIKRLSFLIKAGVPMLESLIMIKEQTLHKRHDAMLEAVIRDVSNGQYLSSSLAKFQNMFGDFSINVISFGESTGILADNLAYLADELKKKNALRKKIIGAFIYPAVVTLATLGIILFLMIYLFPKILPVFASLHIKLPLSTRMVMFFSNFLIHYGFLFFGIIILFVIGFIISLKKYPKLQFYLDKFMMRIPVLGKVVKEYNLANTTRTMGLLLKSGITLGETVAITAKVSSNLVYKQEFEKMSAVVARGEQISVYLSSNRELFPDVLTQIISVGERSGNLSNSLIYLSELYEGEVDEFTKNIGSLIEPVLMIVMGVLIGFIAISIITPIYSITQNLHA